MLVLDFTQALRTREDDISGVIASLDGKTEVVTIAENACISGAQATDGVPCGRPHICNQQAWLAIAHLTGNADRRPIGDGHWDEDARTLTYSVQSGRKRIMG